MHNKDVVVIILALIYMAFYGALMYAFNGLNGLLIGLIFTLIGAILGASIDINKRKKKNGG